MTLIRWVGMARPVNALRFERAPVQSSVLSRTQPDNPFVRREDFQPVGARAALRAQGSPRQPRPKILAYDLNTGSGRSDLDMSVPSLWRIGKRMARCLALRGCVTGASARLGHRRAIL